VDSRHCSPRANASKDPVYLENEALTIQELEDCRREEEIPRGSCCRCLNHSTSMGGTRSKVEGGDRHDLEPEGTREDTRHEIYTGSGS
jgi:hypothetical protein